MALICQVDEDWLREEDAGYPLSESLNGTWGSSEP